jgi:prepilin-type N-terminal cleavage/methylation domain-containing protein
VAKKLAINNRGFTLLEIMIAMTIFAFFVTVFVATQGNNLQDSYMMRQELTLQTLCEQKLNEIVVDPPEFREALTLTTEQKSFEDFPEFEYIIEYKRFELPDFQKLGLLGNRDEQGNEDKESAILKLIMPQVRDFVKEALWQVKVTVQHKETQFPFSLTTWLVNEQAKMKFNF